MRSKFHIISNKKKKKKNGIKKKILERKGTTRLSAVTPATTGVENTHSPESPTFPTSTLVPTL
jgi:hypothetical protein